MNKLGYSKIEILIVVVLLGIVAFITINNTSYAFAIDNNENIAEVKKLIEIQARDYALDNLDLFKETKTTYISVEGLLEAGYLIANDNGLFTDPIDSSKNLNDSKIRLDYDESKNDVTAVVTD